MTNPEKWAALAKQHREEAQRYRIEHNIPDGEPLCPDPWAGMTKEQIAEEAAYFEECCRWRPGRVP